MSGAKCRYFDSCSAPLCPEDDSSLRNSAWFPDEETCHRQDLRGAAWIARQRKIARVAGADFSRGAFTFSMLVHDFTVYGGVCGLNPDDGEITTARVRKWQAEHRRRKAVQTPGFSLEGRSQWAPATPAAETESAEGVSP
jgi:hypothetical protein